MSLQRRLFKTGGRLIRHARYFTLQLAESQLTQRVYAPIIRRIGRLVCIRGDAGDLSDAARAASERG